MKVLGMYLFVFLFLNDGISWENINADQKKQISMWLFSSSRHILNGKSVQKNNLIFPEIKSGLFVTLILDNKVRGCYGSFYHDSNDPKYIIEKYLRGALRSDSRYKPLSLDTIESMQIVLTFASEPEIVDDVYSINTEEYGIMAESGTSVFILVPAELKMREQVAIYINKIKAERIYKFKSHTVTFTQVL